MELKQLEYFRAIVDAGTISGAARDDTASSQLSDQNAGRGITGAAFSSW